MYRLCPFFYFTMCTRIKYRWGSSVWWKYISKTIRLKELCPHICNSIEEFLLMPLLFQVSCWCVLSCDSSWNILWSKCSSSGVHSQITFSISKSRNCSSSLMFDSNCSLKNASDSWVSDGPGIGRVCPLPHSLILHLYILVHCVWWLWLWINIFVFNLINHPDMSEGDITFLKNQLVEIYSWLNSSKYFL